jgi:hypothetical protein
MAITVQSRRVEITIPAAKVSGTHTDKWWTITQDNLPSEMFDSDGSYPARSDGGDVRFATDSAGLNEIPLHVVQFGIDPDPANGTAYINVKIPSVSGETAIWAFYNAPAVTGYAVDDPFGQHAVYSGTAEEGIWLLQESGNGTADEFKDATGNGYHGQGGSGDSGKVPTQTSGLFTGAFAQDFDGTNDKINCGNDAVWDVGTADIAIECIYKSPNVSGFRTMVRHGNGNGVGEWLGHLDSSGNAQAFFLNTSAVSDTVTDPANTDDDAWHHFLAVRDSSAGLVYLYIDGIEVDTTTDNSRNCDTSDKELMIGVTSDAGETNDYEGEIFFVSIHLDDVDDNHANYAATKNNNYRDNSNFATAGTPEDSSIPKVMVYVTD